MKPATKLLRLIASTLALGLLSLQAAIADDVAALYSGRNLSLVAGFNVGGGAEYFTGRTVSLKGEARYHIIGRAAGGQDPSGLVFTGGLKKYW